MSEAVIQSVLSQAESRIEHLTGVRVRLAYEVILNRSSAKSKRSVPKGCETEEQRRFFIVCCGVIMQTPDAVRDKSRQTEFVSMRQAITVALKQKYKMGIQWKQIASIIGVENHTSAIHAYTAGMNYLASNDPMFMQYYTPLKPLLVCA